MVEEQVDRWRRTQVATAGPPACVALSHLPGAAGAEVGRRVAERLGYAFFDREIVEAIARDTGTQAELVGQLDEHVRSLIDRYVVDGVRARGFSEDDYLKGVVRVVQTLAHSGRAVILGRGSTAILNSRQALRVLVVAPRDVRIERIARERGLARDVAAAHLDREEADRAGFIRHHFSLRQDDPSLYDLVVNTASLPLDLAVEVVIVAMRGRFPEVAAGVPRSGTG
jgi:cytidylate kinase